MATSITSILDNTPSLKIGLLRYELEIADTQNERAVGLSNRSEVAENKGMLFVLESEGRPGIWMKDTLIPLDIIWTDATGRVVTIYENAQPESYPEIFEPTADAQFIIELNAGQVDRNGLEEGDVLNISEYVLKLSSEKQEVAS